VNIAEFFVAYAERLGIDTCFSVTGGMAMHFNKAFHDSQKINIIYSHHEQAAVCGAEGYSKIMNFRKPGLACITAGPGVSNSITGLLSAFGDSTPLLVLAGQIKSQDLGNSSIRTHGIQEIHSEDIVTPAVKKFSRISSTNFASEIKAIHSALVTHRFGPVFVEVPLDIQSEDVPNHKELMKNLFSNSLTKQINPVQKSLPIEAIKDLIDSATRVSLYFGNGVRISGLDVDRLIQISDRYSIPRFFSWVSVDLDNSEAPLNGGCPGGMAPIYSNRFLQESDLVIFLGARMDLATTAYQREVFGAGGARVIVEVDPAEIQKHVQRPDDHFYTYDLSNGIEWLAELLTSVKNDKKWIEQFKLQKEKYLSEEDSRLFSDQLTVRDFAINATEILEYGGIVTSSSGYAIESFLRFFKSNGKVRLFCGAALGSMGQGLSHGLGAVAGRETEETPIWIIESDGGLWMSIHELATLKKLNPVNCVLFILDNSGYGSIYNSQERHFSYHSGSTEDSGLLLPDWKKVAEVFNFQYSVVQTKSELISELNASKLTNAPKIIRIKIAMVENRGPSLRTIFNSSGPVTEPLDSLDW